MVFWIWFFGNMVFRIRIFRLRFSADGFLDMVFWEHGFSDPVWIGFFADSRVACRMPICTS